MCCSVYISMFLERFINLYLILNGPLERADFEDLYPIFSVAVCQTVNVEAEDLKCSPSSCALIPSFLICEMEIIPAFLIEL